jgi:hypothetical protein
MCPKRRIATSFIAMAVEISLTRDRPEFTMVPMGKLWRMVAVICIVCQSTLPALSCPCPNSKSGRTRAVCSMRPPSKAAQSSKAAPIKSKCSRCAHAKGCASKKKADFARSSQESASLAKCSIPNSKCEACPYRQAKSEPIQPYVPTDGGREQVVTSAQPIATAAPVLPEHTSICLCDWDDCTLAGSHSERQAQIMCWLK